MLHDPSAELQKGPVFDWNDLRYFLAVAESGSTLAAGRRLRVSQTTVARRVAALEDALGLQLFERLPSGYVLTSAGEAMLPRARDVEAAARLVADGASGAARLVSGTVRITLDEIYATTLLQPVLAELRALHPQLRVDVDASPELRDLASGAADIALRNVERPSGAGLIARRLCDSPWTFYASETYISRHGLPVRPSELEGHVLVAGGGAVAGPIYDQLLASMGLLDSVAFRHGSISGLLAAVRAGTGIAALPCLVADFEPGLIRCMEPGRVSGNSLWVVFPERHRHTPHVRSVADILARSVRARAREMGVRARAREVGGSGR
jgi:DNA-binding transcriptional LysR family regulator